VKLAYTSIKRELTSITHGDTERQIFIIPDTIVIILLLLLLILLGIVPGQVTSTFILYSSHAVFIITTVKIPNCLHKIHKIILQCTVFRYYNHGGASI